LDGVDLVDEDDNLLDPDLTSKEKMFSGLWPGGFPISNFPNSSNFFCNLLHLPIACRNNNNRSVHVSSAGNHVLDVIRMSRTVDVSVMPRIRLVLDMCRRNGDASLSLFRGFVDRAIF
jgi:hypothetical protein